MLSHENKNLCNQVTNEHLQQAHDLDSTTIDNDGQTALHKAAEQGHHELFDTLLEAKADINCRTKDGETPLYTAVDNGWVETTKSLLAAKANPNISRVNGWSPLLNQRVSKP